jgi:DNA (cytosine-5)-methyltransferase 1
MQYGSVCSGIEAATVAWEPLGWTPAWFSEIEEFPKRVLDFHYPEVKNLGDMTKIYDNEIFKKKDIDILVGGTPCQSFSIAGDRKGLDDPRGDLALEFLRIAKVKKPRWFIWENVPGILSSNGGKDFGAFLRSIQKLGYGFAYRVLDAKNFGVPQKRRRVFIVGYLGDWRSAAAVLFESDCCQGNSSSSEKTEYKITCPYPEGAPVNCFTPYPKIGEAIRIYGTNGSAPPVKTSGCALILQGDEVRRLTPTECEKLQGFSGDYTNILGATDSQRYKAIGNSMAIPVMSWIGQRINLIETL